MMKYFVYISKQFVYISKVWWNTLFPFQSNLFTYQKYDEILCLHNKSIWYFIILSNENKTNLSLYYRNVDKLVLILFCICSSRLGLKLGFRLVSLHNGSQRPFLAKRLIKNVKNVKNVFWTRGRSITTWTRFWWFFTPSPPPWTFFMY